MTENPLDTLKSLDLELMSQIEEGRKLAFADGALPGKYKYLIALALDAAHGASDGVRALAQAALGAGATKEEIAETIRTTQFISGVGSAYTASRGLKGVI